MISDIYTEFYNSEVGRELLYFLKKCKVNVKLITLNTSIVALISKGLLDEAKQSLNVFYKKLSNIPKQDLIVGIDPSEALVWRDDAKYLVEKTLQVNLFEEAVIMLNKNNLLPKLKSIDEKVYVHLHCHQKALVGKQTTIDALSLIPKLKVEVLDIGCCGMAGDFGYRYIELSKEIYKNSLNAVSHETPINEVVVIGFSCANIFLQEGKVKLKSVFSLFTN